MRYPLFVLFLFLSAAALAQADNEIQVYASPTIPKKNTIIELHSNYTFQGMKDLPDPRSAKWTFESLEVTTGIAKNAELGFYLFTGFSPTGEYEFLGTHIRPRVAVPTEWTWPVGASLSIEFGFIRTDIHSPFVWEGEIRPILDKAIRNWYFSFNPNVSYVLTGDNKQWGISPQFKTVYTIHQKFGLGLEYYSGLGTFKQLSSLQQQEHLLGPMFDLYASPQWELNTGFLFGLTAGSNQRIFKLLIGRRVRK